MSSELQLDVRHLNRWRRHLVNAYEVRQAWCLLQVKLCDPYSGLYTMQGAIQVLCFTFTFTLLLTTNQLLPSNGSLPPD